MSTSERIKDLLDSHNISLAELSRQTGISRGHLHNIVNKGSSTTIDKLSRIANTLGVFTSELTGEVKDIELFCDRLDLPPALAEFAKHEPDLVWRDVIMLRNLYNAGCTLESAHDWRVLWTLIKGLLA